MGWGATNTNTNFRHPTNLICLENGSDVEGVSLM